MEKNTTLEKIQEILIDILDDDDLTISKDTTAEQVSGWDSITHVKLILACESEFGVSFDSGEVGKLESVGSLVNLVESKKSRN